MIFSFMVLACTYETLVFVFFQRTLKFLKILVAGGGELVPRRGNPRTPPLNETLYYIDIHTHTYCIFNHNTIITIKTIVVRCPSVHPSVTGGHWKQFDLEASGAVYLAREHTKLELGDLCEQQSWHLPQVKAAIF